jgi:hypothetical protein
VGKVASSAAKVSGAHLQKLEDIDDIEELCGAVRQPSKLSSKGAAGIIKHYLPELLAMCLDDPDNSRLAAVTRDLVKALFSDHPDKAKKLMRDLPPDLLAEMKKAKRAAKKSGKKQFTELATLVEGDGVRFVTRALCFVVLSSSSSI